MTSQATNPSDAAPTLTIHPYLGVAGVLLGAMIATCPGRLRAWASRTFSARARRPNENQTHRKEADHDEIS
jgi:hypothetical protein